MLRPLFSVPRRRVLIAALSVGLAACEGQAPAKPAANASCTAERAEFVAAIDPSELPPAAGSADAYYADLRRTARGAAEASAGLATDLAKTADAIDRMTSSFATLKSCRFDRAEEIRTGVVGGSLPADQLAPLMAAERASFQAEMALAGAAVDRTGQRVELLRQVADKLAATAPGTDLKVARAAAAPPPPPQAFVATATTAIYAKPASTGARVASLRRGQRVQGPRGEASPGWVQLALNDGSSGYVESDVLRPVQPNASAVKAAARADAMREAAGDPVAAAVLAARAGLPDRQQALAALVAGASESIDLAFSPTLPAAADPAAPADQP